MTTGAPPRRGGEWLIDVDPPSGSGAVQTTPERVDEDLRMVGRTARDFVRQEVEPALERLEQKDWALARALVRAAGELGLLGTDVPEAYGGVGLDMLAALIVAENVATPASFASTFGGQTNLAILPLVCFGTPDQKTRYVSRLVSGEIVGAYALSESGAGSDALGARARAERLPDGSFALTGEKMWITNGGFADVFVVFAKVDGEHFTAFVVERAFDGVSTGNEEHKMGLHGSSTTPLILEGARVPAENLLGQIGRGHKVAFNTLNYGRLKLGAMCSGGGKLAVAEAARYAAERRQFGRPIAQFGAIRHKLGEMLARIYVVESLLYRTVGLIDERLEGEPDREAALASVLEEYAVEASIAKVAGSEMIDYVLDENVQIHGGNGYVADYPAERRYRDARVNRIFEGTNEINRLLIPGMLIRRAVKGDLGLADAAARVVASSGGTPAPGGDDAASPRAAAVSGLKRLGTMILATAMQTFGSDIEEQQELLGLTADLVIDAYGAESALLRAERAPSDAASAADLHADAAGVAIESAVGRADAASRQAIAAMGSTIGDARRDELLGAARRILPAVPADTVEPRRRLADAVVARGAYPFSS